MLRRDTQYECKKIPGKNIWIKGRPLIPPQLFFHWKIHTIKGNFGVLYIESTYPLYVVEREECRGSSLCELNVNKAHSCSASVNTFIHAFAAQLNGAFCGWECVWEWFNGKLSDVISQGFNSKLRRNSASPCNMTLLYMQKDHSKEEKEQSRHYFKNLSHLFMLIS